MASHRDTAALGLLLRGRKSPHSLPADPVPRCTPGHVSTRHRFGVAKLNVVARPARGSCLGGSTHRQAENPQPVSAPTTPPTTAPTRQLRARLPPPRHARLRIVGSRSRAAGRSRSRGAPRRSAALVPSPAAIATAARGGPRHTGNWSVRGRGLTDPGCARRPGRWAYTTPQSSDGALWTKNGM